MQLGSSPNAKIHTNLAGGQEPLGAETEDLSPLVPAPENRATSKAKTRSPWWV